MRGRRTRVLRAAAVGPVVALLLGAACTTGSGASGGEQEGTALVLVLVRNSLVPRTSLVIRVVSSSGIRHFLGRMPAGADRSFRFDAPSLAGDFRLRAEAADGGEVSSRPFSLFPGAVVTWTLPDNSLSVGHRQPDGDSTGLRQRSGS